MEAVLSEKNAILASEVDNEPFMGKDMNMLYEFCISI